jgi:hypothetical protein
LKKNIPPVIEKSYNKNCWWKFKILLAKILRTKLL